MNAALCDVVGRVVAHSDREHPADAVLREALRDAAGLDARATREISRTVFTYFRWAGWLRNVKGMTARIERAIELAESFQKKPFFMPEDAFRAKAVPDWTAGEVDVTIQWLHAIQREPKLWLRAQKGRGREVAKKLGETRKAPLPDALIYEGKTDLFRTKEFEGGEFELQDISSQAVGFACNPQPGETWWDACAGEGGKTLHLSTLMENRGLVWASDRAEWRLERLKRRTARAGVFNYRSVLWDGGEELPTGTKFDGVLIDAPCSGIGTWQRNPHARWTTTAEDVRELAELQLKLVTHAAAGVKPGGKIIYAVCTLAKAETEGVVAAFESGIKDFTPLAFRNPLAPERPAAPRLWLWPQDCHGNGMFIAAWQRKAV